MRGHAHHAGDILAVRGVCLPCGRYADHAPDAQAPACCAQLLRGPPAPADGRSTSQEGRGTASAGSGRRRRLRGPWRLTGYEGVHPLVALLVAVLDSSARWPCPVAMLGSRGGYRSAAPHPYLLRRAGFLWDGPTCVTALASCCP